MKDTRGLDLNMENTKASNAGVYLYNPWSGFINLTKVKQVKIAKEEKAIRRRESKETGRTSTLKRWIWKTVVGVMDSMINTMDENLQVKQTSSGDMRMSKEESIQWGW